MGVRVPPPASEISRETLLVVLAVAALAPVLADLPARVRVPVVVTEIMAGIVVGPQVLGLADPDPLLDALSDLGLAFLFFMVGMAEVFHIKLDAVGYGFLIPIFFISTGIGFDLDALLGSAATLLLVPVFAALFLLARGLPAWLLTRAELPPHERTALALFTASALPLVVAITEVATESGRLAEDDAAALVGAAMLSLLAFPLIDGAAQTLTGDRPRLKTSDRSARIDFRWLTRSWSRASRRCCGAACGSASRT